MSAPPLPAADLDHILARTPGLWEELRGRRLFLTGGTGFFGTWLLESFVHANQRRALGASAVVLTRDPGAFARKAPQLAAQPALRFWAGDVRDFAFPPGEFPLVIHAATEASATLNEENPALMRETIVAGTERVLALAAQAGTQKFLFTSSGAVYGRQPPEMTHVPEDFPGSAEAHSVYGEGKRAAEAAALAAGSRHGFAVKIARGFAFVGPHLPLDAHFAIGNFIRDALGGGPIRIAGDGTPHRSYLYAADLMIWLWTILLRGPDGRAYNVGSGRDHTIAEVARIVNDAMGGRCTIEIARPPVPGGPVSRYVPDVRRAGAELGLQESIDLAAAVRRTAAWHGWPAPGAVLRS
jgi:dTDP-glucose 4,6-dehydratase